MRPATSLMGVNIGVVPLGSTTVSYATLLMPRCTSARASLSSAARCRYVNSSWPGRSSCSYSTACGSFTFIIMSACANTAAASGSSCAPAAVNSASGKPLPSPAAACTSTLWPACTRVSTAAGVSATRYSLSLISFGTPIIMLSPSFFFGSKRCALQSTSACTSHTSRAGRYTSSYCAPSAVLTR